MTAAPSENAGVIVRPPFLYLGSIAAGVVLQLVFPAPVFPGPVTTPVGAGLITVAALLFGLALREFQRANTPIPTHQPSRALVRSGPYRFSRNPIYLAMTLLHLGVAIWVNSLWLLLLLAVVLVVMRLGVIAREERYLERRFGAPYRDYCAQVRRWL